MAARPLEPIRSEFRPVSIGARAADELRARIAEGSFTPGQRLNEVELSESLQISRNTVREAFLKLEGERLVVRATNRGVFVATLHDDDVRDIFTLRRTIEVEAIRSGGNLDAVHQMRDAISRGKTALDAGNESEIGSANNDFHRSVVRLADSARLDTIIDQALAELRLLFLATPPDDHHKRWLSSNEQICEHLEHGDRDAASALMYQYLVKSEGELILRLSHQRHTTLD